MKESLDMLPPNVVLSRNYYSFEIYSFAYNISNDASFSFRTIHKQKFMQCAHVIDPHVIFLITSFFIACIPSYQATKMLGKHFFSLTSEISLRPHAS